MGQFCVSRHGRESLGAEQRQNENAAEADVKARERQNDEAACRQQVGEALESGKPQDRSSRETLTNAYPAAPREENRQQRKHSDNGDAADDRQLAAVEIAPVTPAGLN